MLETGLRHLQKFDIRVGHSRNWTDNALCHYHEEPVPEGHTQELVCDIPTYGRYVSVSQQAQLTICEAEVYGYAEGKYITGLILGWRLASEGRRYKVTQSLIGWART